jgi:glycerophosphoryl diester phosphodiesterase
MVGLKSILTLTLSLLSTVALAPLALAQEGDGSRENQGDVAEVASMAKGLNGYTVQPILTIGETLSGTSGALNPSTAGDYTPVGILDGLGAFKLNNLEVRVLANHELLNFRGNSYEVSNGQGGTFSMTGARVSYFDIDRRTRKIVDAGLAYNLIYDANGEIATDTSFLLEGFGGFSRFCSSNLIEPREFRGGRGLEDRIYFTGEEDGGQFNPVGGAEWALDPATGTMWQLPDLGRGAWENVTTLNTGRPDKVAVILADDSSPFNFNPDDDEVEAVPLYLYVGTKQPGAKLASGEEDFPAVNGLRGGKLYVWVANEEGVDSPLEFRGSGSLPGRFVEIDNAPQLDSASEDGSTGFDEYGYPTQSNLVTQAEKLGAFGFSRPEDVATNPRKGNEFVLASTGVDTFDVDPATGNGADSFGTMYTMAVDFSDIDNPTGDLVILYDGDADPERQLRSPDNLDWADNGKIYVQEDEAEEDTLTGEPLFGAGAANPNEAGIVEIERKNGGEAELTRIANIDRDVVLDFSIPVPTDAVDVDAGDAGEWETSGILDVSKLFNERPGTLFLFDVQAHGIEDQDQFNADSRIVDGDLVEGGQLSFLAKGDAAK